MKQNKVEKLLAGVLSISLAMGVSVMPAFASVVSPGLISIEVGFASCPPLRHRCKALRMRICPGVSHQKLRADQHGYDLPGRDLYVYDRPGYRDRRIGGH